MLYIIRSREGSPSSLRLPTAPPSGSMMRLVRELGLAGVRRGRKVRTTMPGKEGQRASDLLRRDFTAASPEPALGSRPHASGDLVRDRVRIVLDFSRAIVGSGRRHLRADQADPRCPADGAERRPGRLGQGST